jgi:hypothetical protein
MPAEYELELRTDGPRIEYGLEVDADDGGTIAPISGTTGPRTGDYYDSATPYVAGGGIDETDLFDRYTVDGQLIRLAITNDAEDALKLLADGEEVSREDLLPDNSDGDESGSEDDQGDESQQPDFGSPDEPRRFYIYGDDWKGSNQEPIYYSAAIDGEADLADKADRFDVITEYDDSDLTVITGSIPANSDDAFSITGTVAWMHGPRNRLNVQLNKQPYEPVWRADDPLDRDGLDGGDESSGSGDDTESGSGSDDGSGSGTIPDDGNDLPGQYAGIETDGPNGPDPDLASEFDHYIEINGVDYPRELRYHLVTTGEIQPASTGDRVDNRGWFGHADGRLQSWRDGFYFDGTLLDIKVGPLSVGEYRRKEADTLDKALAIGVFDLPYFVNLDGRAIDHDRFDPRTAAAGTPLDIPIGYREDALPGRLVPGTGDADTVIRSADDLFDAFDGADDGDLQLVDDRIEYDGGGDGTVLSSNADALTIACTSNGHLKRTDTPDSHWSNFTTRFGGNNLSFVNVTHEGSFTEPKGYDSGGSFALTTDGRYPAFLNCKLWNWGVTALDFRGHGETVLGYDAHDIQIDGSGYGIGTSGNAELEGDNPEEYNRVQPWQERTAMKFLRIDACRHFLERAKNGSSEARWYVLGENSRHGATCDDSHRFSQGEDIRTDRVLMKPNPPVPGDNVRGRPRLLRRARTWYAGWDEDWQDQLDPRTAERNPDPEDEAPLAQFAATDPEYKNREHGWDASNGPVIPHPEEDNTRPGEQAEADPLVWQADLGTLQAGGTRPEFITDELYDAVSYFRDQR